MKNHDKIQTKLVSAYLLLCFGAALLQILFCVSPLNPRLVYCPLQNKWVKSNGEIILAIKDFDDFCATDKRKEFIKTKIQLKTHFAPFITENLVFDYLERGNQVFSLFSHSPEIPPREYFKKSSTIAANSNLLDFSIKLTNEKFDFEQFARPPTFSAQGDFSSQFICPLSAISRNINPRSPPIGV